MKIFLGLKSNFLREVECKILELNKFSLIRYSLIFTSKEQGTYKNLHKSLLVVILIACIELYLPTWSVGFEHSILLGHYIYLFINYL